MEKVPRSVLTKELKEEVAKMVIEGGLSQPEVCRRLSLANFDPGPLGEAGEKRRHFHVCRKTKSGQQDSLPKTGPHITSISNKGWSFRWLRKKGSTISRFGLAFS